MNAMNKTQSKSKRVTLADVRREAAKHGAEVDEQGSGYSGRYYGVIVDLPAGKVWNANLSHSIYENSPADRAEWRSGVCADAIDRMREGTSDCEDPDCEHCHPE
jgi:hypothetical protein